LYFDKNYYMRTFQLAALLLLALLLSAPFSRSFCQNISGDTIKSMLVKDWERAKAYTQEYMNTMPSDKYSLKATDSVRSFAQQLLHLANANMFFAATGTGEKSMASGDPEKRASAQTADSVKLIVNSSYDFAINAIKKMSPSAFMETASVSMGQSISGTRLSWLLKGFEHQTHHRGQTTIYIRLAGIKPPNERLF
jgi:uncharacterized damage-inducible protein DinB